MNIKDIVRKHLTEAQMSRETEAFLLNKWRGSTPESVKIIYDWFESVKNGFPLDPDKVRGGLLAFLGWFNGSSPKREKFDLKNIRNIRAYSLEQIKRLWTEYKTEPFVIGDENVENKLSVDKVFYDTYDTISDYTIKNYVTGNLDTISEKDKNTLSDLLQKSKDLWFGTRYLVFEDEGFRVYEIPDQITSMAYGWFLYFVRYKYDFRGNNWCTTYPNSNNLFISKRRDRSFYFVIDESKKPDLVGYHGNPQHNESDPFFYLGALQILNPEKNTHQYKLTGIHNPGEPIFDTEGLLKIYPKLAPLIQSDKLVYKPWDDSEALKKERGGRNPVDLINEIEGDEYEFAIRPANEKIEYINRPGATIQKSRSWRSMTDAMKKQYSFGTLTRENMFDKFSTSDLFKAMTQGERKTLENKINILRPNEGGIKLIVNNIMQNDFYVNERLSLNKDYLSLYKSRTTGKFGIFNLNENNWVNHDGVTYDDEYKQISQSAYQTTDKKRFYVLIYSRSSQPDNTSFYFLLPITGNKIDGYFVSAKKWEELKVMLVSDKGNPEKTNTDFDPETEDDINELLNQM